MPYQNYYNNTIQPVPTGTRSRSSVFGGIVCPQACSFGRVHGTSPAIGSIQYRNNAGVSVGQIVSFQIGESTFIGMVIKLEKDGSVTDGSNIKVSLVDARDKLHDINHFAQYNMISNDGTWWHMLPKDWYQQVPTYVNDVQDIGDFNEEQELPWDFNELPDTCMPLLSAFSLLNYFGNVYQFSFTATDAALAKIKTSYPDNLDFNSGTKVIDCIQTILDKLNLRFTAWGNLHLHITQPGIPDSAFERAILSGTVNLCSLQGHVDASLGTELNEQGRRVIILGDRNSYEDFYPCLPDWNYNFSLDFCNDTGMQLQALLIKYNLTSFNKLIDLPEAYHDTRKFNGRPRNEMSIRDYIDQIPYKVYSVDFDTKLKDEKGVTDFLTKPSEIDEENTYYEEWLLDHFESITPTPIGYSVYPVSNRLVSDSEHQFFVEATSRKIDLKGRKDAELFFNGFFTYITDGTNLEVEEKIVSIPDSGCRRKYIARVIFSDRHFRGEANALDYEQVEIKWKPDTVFVRLALDKEVFSLTLGEARGGPRTREIVKSVSGLRRGFLFDDEQVLLAKNFIDQGFINGIKANEVANEVAARTLNHEFLTTAGHITFRGNAGYMPSGIIESVNVSFNATQGTREVINFTNVFHDDRVPTFIPIPRRLAKAKGEEKFEREFLQKEQKRILAEANKAEEVNPFGIGFDFGKDGVAAVMLSLATGAGGNPDADAGDVLVLLGEEDVEAQPDKLCDGISKWEWDGSEWDIQENTCNAGCVPTLPTADTGGFSGGEIGNGGCEQAIIYCQENRCFWVWTDGAWVAVSNIDLTSGFHIPYNGCTEGCTCPQPEFEGLFEGDVDITHCAQEVTTEEPTTEEETTEEETTEEETTGEETTDEETTEEEITTDEPTTEEPTTEEPVDCAVETCVYIWTDAGGWALRDGPFCSVECLCGPPPSPAGAEGFEYPVPCVPYDSPTLCGIESPCEWIGSLDPPQWIRTGLAATCTLPCTCAYPPVDPEFDGDLAYTECKRP